MPLSESEIQELVETRRSFHRRPELGFREQMTAQAIASKLRGVGCTVQTGVGETGVVGLISGEGGGPTVLLRADIDGLPIQEQNQCEYASTHPGIMHACGHDGHIAISLLLAKRLMSRRGSLRGNVKFAFQPAEELLSGAQKMVNDGVMEDPRVDAVFGLHLWNNLEVGTVAVVAGPMMASVDRFELVVKGKGGHGAMPHQTVDAVLVAGQIVTALQSIVSRNIDPLDSVVITVGTIQGGSAFNVIAETAALTGTVRTFDPATYEAVPKTIERVIAGVCQAQGAEYELSYERLCQPTVNDPSMAQLARDAAEEVVGPENVVDTREARTTCGEDLAVFLNQVPGCYIFIGSRNREKGLDQPHHSSRFDFDEAALPIGVEILQRVATKYLAAQSAPGRENQELRA